MTMIRNATAAAMGFDANTKITAARAKALKDAGFEFAIRYLTRGTKPPQGDLDAEETRTILESGLALMAVQHVAKEGWAPTEKLGQSYGRNAASHAREAELPEGISVFLDLEGVDKSAAPEDVIQYCNAWHDEVEAAGYFPGLYVGANCGLDGDDLFYRLKIKCYWKSGSNVPEIPVRGYCMFQTIKHGDKVGGVEIDRNVVRPDHFGTAPVWAVAGLETPALVSFTASTPGLAATSVSTAGLVPFSASVPNLDENESALVEMGKAAGVEEAMKRMALRRRALSPGSMPRYWAIANFNTNSRFPRLFVFDRVERGFTPYLCAHGVGSEGDADDGIATIFSNESGSHMSSLGIYRCAEPYTGTHGLSLKLDGLDPTNSHARARAIVIHGASYVSPEFIEQTGRIGRSHGCPAVENRYAGTIVEQLCYGSFLMIWHDSLATHDSLLM